jgi:hypothetical protein
MPKGKKAAGGAGGGPICVGRRCFNSSKFRPTPDSAYRYKGEACTELCEAGSNLCTTCLKNEKKYMDEPEGRLLWHGRIGGILPEKSRIEGSAWNIATAAKEAAKAAKDAAAALAGAPPAVKKKAKAAATVAASAAASVSSAAAAAVSAGRAEAAALERVADGMAAVAAAEANVGGLAAGAAAAQVKKHRTVTAKAKKVATAAAATATARLNAAEAGLARAEGAASAAAAAAASASGSGSSSSRSGSGTKKRVRGRVPRRLHLVFRKSKKHVPPTRYVAPRHANPNTSGSNRSAFNPGPNAMGRPSPPFVFSSSSSSAAPSAAAAAANLFSPRGRKIYHAASRSSSSAGYSKNSFERPSSSPARSVRTGSSGRRTSSSGTRRRRAADSPRIRTPGTPSGSPPTSSGSGGPLPDLE